MPKRPVYGVGINDSKDPVYTKVNGKQVRDKIYAVWQSMLGRCYGGVKVIGIQSYSGCTVDLRWHNFSVFKTWMETQGYEGKCLDKDILEIGNKVYSPETCCFVTNEINALAMTAHTSNKQVGVTSSHKRFRAGGVGRGTRYLGIYDTPEEAYEVHVLAKVKHIREKAQEVEDLRIREGLLKHAMFWEQKIE